MAQIEIIEVSSPNELAQVKSILWAYGESRGFDAAMGNFKEELEKLPYRYARPDGCLLLAKMGEHAVGCVAYQKLGPHLCEMKRLYVDPQYRGLKIGNQLVKRICEEARLSSYTHMRLDTFDYYKAAIHAYLKFGFYEIPAYQKYGMEGILFFEKNLNE